MRRKAASFDVCEGGAAEKHNREEEGMLRRLGLALSIVATACLAVIASASGGQEVSIPVTWVMAGPTATPPPADELLPSCGAVTGSNWLLGTGTLTFFEPTGKASNFQSMAHGTAVDNTGNTYTWNYHQSVKPFGDGSQVNIVDDFVLSGSGPLAGIHSQFHATASETDFEFTHLFGDPENCDPL